MTLQHDENSKRNNFGRQIYRWDKKRAFLKNRKIIIKPDTL